VARNVSRWGLFRGYSIAKNGNPYLDRLRIIQTPLLSLYIHRIHTPDVDEYPHDHPWWFCSVVLSGAYAEQVHKDPLDLSICKRYHRRRGSFHFMGRMSAHQITDITDVLWTLIITGPHRGSWRFWTSDGPVDWKEVVRETQ
jgi:hypothetical protein